MAFQAEVATWFAVHILVRLPVGGRLGINNAAIPVAIRLETGEALDDIEVTQSDGGALHIQCKTRATLSAGEHAPLAKTIGQLARWVGGAKSGNGLPDLTRNAALLAVRSDAPRSLDNLEAGCRAFDLGGSWSITRDQRNQAEREALAAFEVIATPAWTAHQGNAPSDEDLADMARVFNVGRFSMDEGDADWREASRLLGRLIYGDEASGDAPLRDLRAVMRNLIGSGAPAGRVGLLRELRKRGHQDVGAPGYEADLARLRAASAAELTRLAVHGRLPLGGGIAISRECGAPLLAAMTEGSLLVVGDPGAGKTGALVHASAAAAARGDTVIFLAVDRYPGVAIMGDLSSELGLSHPVLDTLAAMPGSGRKMLVIDALDAARGGPSESVFASLLEEVRERLADDWIVVASIRTFDLRNGQRFRQAFAGQPANPDYAEVGLAAVRHFLVPLLSTDDLAAAGTGSPELAALLASAPPHLTELLRNVFNLSLAAQLLADGIDPAAFGGIRTQSGLIDAYEDARLRTSPMRQAAASAAAAMAARRRLTVRKVVIDHPALDDVIQSGVLAETGDLVGFAHHVLFDHVTGRFHLAWDEPDTLISQLAGNTSTALLLAPALRFAVERLWRTDNAERPNSWQLVAGIFSGASIDPVLGNVALRIAVENIDSVGDVTGLINRVLASPADPAIAAILGRLARFASMDIDAAKSVAQPSAVAWATLARSILSTGELALIDPARVLLHSLFEHGDFNDTTLLGIFGEAARALLERAWAATPPLSNTSTNAIRFVGKSFGSDPVASRSMLDRILREPHFSQYADREASWLAEQIIPIARADPAFAVEIYAALYGQTINDQATSWLGGTPSRILPLSSNRRQDYEHCRWQLGKAMGDLLVISPHYGTRALIDALIGKVATRGYGSDPDADTIDLGSTTIELRGFEFETSVWDEQDDEVSRDDDLLGQFVSFLRSCSVQDFAACVAAASQEYATGTVWARILGVGAERLDEVGGLLWPLVERPGFLENLETRRDAVKFVAAAWTQRSDDELARFETMAIDTTRFSDADERQEWHRVLGRLLPLIPEDALQLEEMRALRRQLDSDGLMTDNEPLARFTSEWVEREGFERRHLERSGVDLSEDPIREVLAAAEALYAQVQNTPPESEALALASLWAAAEALLVLLDEYGSLHEQVDRRAWGYLSNAVERIASSKNYDPGVDNLPELPAMFAVLERLSNSRYPEPREDSE